MPQNKKKFIYGLVLGCFLSTFVFLAINIMASPVSAQVAIGNYGATFGLGTADLVSTIIKIVQWVLGFLGLIAVIMIMYGGFVWMTAGGNVEKVKKAKQIITRAVIGLIIVLLAWAIVLFIHNMVNKATGGPGGGCPPGNISGCWECNAAGTGYTIYHSGIPGCGLGADTFRVRWVDPEDGEIDVPLCSIIQAYFNGNILVASVPGNAHLYVDNDVFVELGNGQACGNNNECLSGVCQVGVCQGDEVNGTWQVASDHRILEFLPVADYLPNTQYHALLDAPGIEEDSASPRTFTGKSWWFTTGTTTLDVPPTVTQIYPDDGSNDICLNTLIQSKFSSKMRVSSINGNTVKFRDLTVPEDLILKKFGYPDPKSFSTRPSKLMQAGHEHSVTLVAGTPGGTCENPVCVTKEDCIGPGPGQCQSKWHYNEDGIMDVCFNHLDGDYDTNDEGSVQDDFMSIPGHPNAGDTPPWNFFADTDTTNARCIPQIIGINPNNGKYHDTPAVPGDESLVTITGSNLGITGNVNFYNGIIDQANCFNGARFPNQNCVASWGGAGIDIHVPGGPINYGDVIPSNGAKDGPVAVSIDPGVCLGGANDYDACNVPADCPGGSCATDSNGWDFNVTSPQIKKVSGLNSQAHGGIGQYVTLYRRSDSDAGFGDVAGRVLFRRLSNGAEVQADVPPDPPCKRTWTNDRVIIKVPDLSGIGVTACDTTMPLPMTPWNNCDATHQVGIQVELNGGAVRSNLIRFIYTDEPLGPGLCDVNPECGTGNDNVTLSGENFGTAAGSVQFTMPPNAPENAPVTGWADQTIGSRVPNINNADDPYEVDATKTVAGVPYTSNSLPFTVPCGGVPKVVVSSACAAHCNGGAHNGEDCTTNNDLCLPGGACILDDVPSPNPYKNDTDVCVNASTGARFTVPMDQTTLTIANIKLYRCNDPDNSPSCTAQSEIVGTIFNYPAADTFTLRPPANFDTSRYYKVVIFKDVESGPPTPGVKMNSDFSWVFKTKDNAGPCPVERIYVLPSKWTLAPPVTTTANYTGTPMGPRCTLLNPADYTWAWASTAPAVATVTGSVVNTETATAGIKGATYIQATAGLKTGKGYLKVDPDSCAFSSRATYCADPDNDLTDECPDSVCDILADRCTPVIADYDPNQGARGTTITIEGCYFGDYVAGSSNVVFGGPPGFADGEFKCANPWSRNLIVTTVPQLDRAGNPLALGGYPLDIQTADGFSSFTDSEPPQQNKMYNVTNTCSNFAPVPGTGVPGLCSLDPNRGREGTLVDFHGFNIPPLSTPGTPPHNPGDTFAQFSDGAGGYIDSIQGQANAAGDIFVDATVPANTFTGPARLGVQVGVGPNDYCPSNSLPFGISCSSAADCPSTGCCKYDIVIGAKVCQPAANCIPPVPGAPCLLPANQPYGACLVGVSPDKLGDFYDCIDSEGHLANTPPPTRSYPPAAQDNCRVCCDPDQDNDDNTADDPMTLLSGLKCTPNVSPCDGAGNERGLYCGCTNDAQCGAPTTIGCGSGNPQCCLGRPKITEPTAPAPDQTGVCLNTAIKVNFDQALDPASLNVDNVVVYSAVGAPLSRAGNSYNTCSDNGNPCFPANPLSCTGSSGGDASSCTGNAEWTYNNIPFPSDDNYLIYVKSGNNDPPVNGVVDLSPLGVYHNIEIYLDGELTPRAVIKNLASQFNNPANNYQYGLGSLGSVTSGNHAVRVRWINDWCAPAPGGCDDGDSNIMINGIGIIRGDVVPGRIQSAGNGFAVYPSANLASNTEYQVFVRGGARADPNNVPAPTINNELGIRNKNGVFMWDTNTAAPQDISGSIISRLWRFTTGADICKLDHIDLTMYHFIAGTGTDSVIDPGPDVFLCAANNCDKEDFDWFCPTTGNQHVYGAELKDKAGNTINSTPFTFNWYDSVPFGSIDIEPQFCGGAPPSDIRHVTARANNGEEKITVSAVDSDVNPPDYGSATVSARAIVNLCENLWPDLLAGVQFPFSDDVNVTMHMAFDPPPYTNFQTFYCRDNGNSILPKIQYNDAVFPDQQPIIKVNTPSDLTKDELIKEFFFIVDNEQEDAIGIRVLENQDNLSPELWYKKQFGPAAPKVEKTTVNGYQAVKQGRTVYVAATNLADLGCSSVCTGPGSCCADRSNPAQTGTIFTNIYLISYNDKATEETVEIYKRLLANWTFNTNVIGDLTAFKRDLRRINDLKDIYFSLLSYKTNHSDTFPKLAGGTYLNNMSTSVWPSWQDTLGQELDRTLPVDPINTIFSCPYCTNIAATFSAGQELYGIDIDSEGNVYVAGSGAGDDTLYKCDINLVTCKPIKTYIDPWILGAVHVDKNNGNILVAIGHTIPNNGYLDRLDKEGNSLGTYSGGCPGTCYYRNVRDIETDNRGNYFLTFGNGTFPTGIRKFKGDLDPTAHEVTVNLNPFPADNEIATGLAVDKDNNIYVTTRRDTITCAPIITAPWSRENPSCVGGNKIIKYDNNLQRLADFGDRNEFIDDSNSISAPNDIAVDNQGHVFVNEHMMHRVVMLDNELKQKLNAFGEWDVSGTDKYHFTNPLGIRYYDGYLFVTESVGKRLIKFKPDFDQCKVCWNEITKTYQCNEGSHIYQYGVTSDGSISNLYAALEYTGPGNWINYAIPPLPPATSLDPCDPFKPSSCQCFNYQHVVTGSSLDYDNPRVTFNNPVNNQIVSGNHLVSVNVTDPSGNDITKVEFFVDGVRQFTDGVKYCSITVTQECGQDSDCPVVGETCVDDTWTWTWDTTKFADRIAPDPPHILKAVAYDEYGNFGSGSINVYINNLAGGDTTPPTVIITKPIDGTTISGNNVTFEAHASDASGIFGMQLRVDGNPLLVCNVAPFTPCVRTIDTTTLSNGQHTLRAEATPGAGPSGSAQITVTIDNGDITAPEVNITSQPGKCTCNVNADCPLAGDSCEANKICKLQTCADNNECIQDCRYSGNVAITADARDCPVLESCVAGRCNITTTRQCTGVTKVEFYVDGNLRSTDPVALYEWLWQTVLAFNGNHTVQVMAYDSAGNTGSANIQVNVKNGVTLPLMISFRQPPTPEQEDPPRVISGTSTILVEATQGAVVRARFILDGVFQLEASPPPPAPYPPADIAWNWNTALSPDGTHTVKVVGYDADGNPSPAIGRTFTTSNGTSDIVPPIIGATSINPLSGQCGVTTFTITAQITDVGSGIDPATTIAHIQRPDGTDVATVLLVDSGGGIFQGTFLPAPPLCIVGLNYAFWVDITASDLRGNYTEKDNI